MAAAIVARVLMSQHGLSHWRLDFKDWVWTAGNCDRRRCIITLSRLYLGLPDWTTDHTREIVLHEVAHALTTNGHEPEWEAVAKRLGCSGDKVPKLPYPRGRGMVEGGRLKWWATLPCRSGIHPGGHRAYVVATREQDDDGDWMRLESVGLARIVNVDVHWGGGIPDERHQMVKTGRRREIKDRLGVGDISDLIVEAQEEWSRAMDANRVEEKVRLG